MISSATSPTPTTGSRPTSSPSTSSGFAPKNLPSGSPLWFDARYGLALAYFHAGQQRESAQLIDATAILHPDLGGGTLQKKFIRLRQRLGAKP